MGFGIFKFIKQIDCIKCIVIADTLPNYVFSMRRNTPISSFCSSHHGSKNSYEEGHSEGNMPADQGRPGYSGHRGRGNRRDRFHHMPRSEVSTAEGQHFRHPPGLKGRDIGMWYAERSKKNTKEMYTAPQLMMEAKEAHVLNHALDRLGSEALGAICYENILDAQDTKKQKTFSLSQRLGRIQDSEFKRAYAANIEGNQNEGEEKFKSSTSGLVQDPKMDLTLYSELLEKESSNRYKKMLEFRMNLPSFKMKDEILDIIHHNQVVVISGETGCGKTTQVAQFILDHCIRGKRGSTCAIACTQPRRISAISVAQRVAEERAEELGSSVGYQIRLESVLPRRQGSILFCTTGIILQYLISDPLLSKISYLILDEIHERDVLSDFLICLARDLLPQRPDMKVILMSATINAEMFSKYFNDCSMIHIPGFTFSVQEYYLEDVLELTRFKFSEERKKMRGYRGRWKEQEAAKEFEELILPHIRSLGSTSKYSNSTLHELSKASSEELNLELIIHLLDHICRLSPGAVLIFLPGWENISKLNKMLEEEASFRSYNLRVVPLHSLMPTVNQRTIFDRPPPGCRKIVIATNIAETSITIDDIVYVIDCGRIKMKRFDKESNISTLLPEWSALANSTQRRGRAGRVQEGICYHLYSKAREMALKPFPLPEILRIRLEEVILQVKILKLGSCKAFLGRVLDAPDEDVIDISVKMLQAINALDENENLTPLGFHLAKLPMDPLTGKMLLMGAIFSCLSPILTVAASLSFKDPFVVPLNNEKAVDRRRVELARNTKSDHLMLVNVYDGWEWAKQSGSEKGYLRENFLSPSVLNQLRNMRKQFVDQLFENKFINSRCGDSKDLNYNSDNLCLVKAVITAGLYPNVTRILKKTGGRDRGNMKSIVLPDRQKVAVHMKSVNAEERRFESNWLIYWEKVKSTKIFLHDTTMVSNYPLLLFGENLEYDPNENVINVDGFVKVGCSKEVADVIKKLRVQLDELLEYKISHPGMTYWGMDTKEGKFLSLVVQTLESERADSYSAKREDVQYEDYQ